MSAHAVQDQWVPVGLATATAGAVLLGVLLVIAAVRRAARSRAVGPVVLLLVSLAVLATAQSAVAVGLEVAVLGLALGIATVVLVASGPAHAAGWPDLLPLLPAVGLVVGGILVETDTASGFLWTFGGVVAGLVLAVQGTWSTATADEH